MRYGIFGDIHGNLEALDAVLAALAGARVDRFLCLGDLVGYGANPRECIARVRELGCLVVAGNHDLAAAGLLDLQDFNPVARTALEWCRRELAPEDIAYLKDLPLVARTGDITCFHATLPQPEAFDYLDTLDKVSRAFAALRTRLGFFGHSHVPVALLGSPDQLLLELDHPVQLPNRGKVLANPGSVGQPRDGDPRAAFAILDLCRGTLSFERTPYDIASAQAKIRRAGLPPDLADRLALGY